MFRVATAGSKEARELEKIKKLYEKIYRETSVTTTDSDVKYYMSQNVKMWQTNFLILNGKGVIHLY